MAFAGDGVVHFDTEVNTEIVSLLQCRWENFLKFKAESSEHSTEECRLLTPALSSFREERENYFVGRFPGVGACALRTSAPTPG